MVGWSAELGPQLFPGPAPGQQPADQAAAGSGQQRHQEDRAQGQHDHRARRHRPQCDRDIGPQPAADGTDPGREHYHRRKRPGPLPGGSRGRHHEGDHQHQPDRLHPDHRADHDGHEHQGVEAASAEAQHAGVARVEGADGELLPAHHHHGQHDRADHDAGAQIRPGQDRGVAEQVVLDPALARERACRDHPHQQHPGPEEGGQGDRHGGIDADLGQTGDQIGQQGGGGAHHHGAQDQPDHGAAVGPDRDGGKEGQQGARERRMGDDITDQRLFAQIGEGSQRTGDQTDHRGAQEDHAIGVVHQEVQQGHQMLSRKASSPAVTS